MNGYVIAFFAGFVAAMFAVYLGEWFDRWTD